MTKLDPFENTFELVHGLVGPEMWRKDFPGYSVAARYHKGHGRVMVLAAGMIGEDQYQCAEILEEAETLDDTLNTIIDNAFRRAKEAA